MVVKLIGNPLDLSIIKAYAPTGDVTDDNMEDVNDKLDLARKEWNSQEILIVNGDLMRKSEREGEMTLWVHMD